MKMGKAPSKMRVNKGKAPTHPPQSGRNEGLGDLTSMEDWSTTLMKQGKFTEATELSRQVLEMSRTELVPEHPDSLSRMFRLGLALHVGGRFGDAGTGGFKALFR